MPETPDDNDISVADFNAAWRREWSQYEALSHTGFEISGRQAFIYFDEFRQTGERQVILFSVNFRGLGDGYYTDIAIEPKQPSGNKPNPGKNDKPGKNPTLIALYPTAYVEKLNGNANNLHIYATGIYSENTGATLAMETFRIENNATGVYSVGGYNVYVDVKGRTQIRECYFY
jgi:hypothetical protein